LKQKPTKKLDFSDILIGAYERRPAGNIAFVLLGLMNTVFQLSVRCSAFCPSVTFTIEQQNKILSLVTTFGCRRRGRRIDESPNSTNAWTLAASHKARFRESMEKRAN